MKNHIKNSVDFLILYEVFAREFESVCLVKYELERRGYKVIIKDITNKPLKRNKLSAKVIVAPFFYKSSDIDAIIPHVKKIPKIVNLQWEQIFRNGTEEAKIGKKYNISGFAKEVVHISWGLKNYKRLVQDCNINPDFVKIVGNISLDLLRPEFKQLYINKDKFLSLIDIEHNSMIISFISSFNYVGIPEILVSKSSTFQGLDIDSFRNISNLSQQEILKWFEKALNIHKNLVIIYRPHPVEKISKNIISLNSRFKNFIIDRKYTLNQILMISDCVLNWYSTSLANTLILNKKMLILRPLEIPNNLDVSLIVNKSKFIKCENDFLRAINGSDEFSISINDTDFSNVYFIDNKSPSYQMLCDILEEIFTSKKYCISYSSYIFNNMRIISIAYWRFRRIFKKVKSSILSINNKENRSNQSEVAIWSKSVDPHYFDEETYLRMLSDILGSK